MFICIILNDYNLLRTIIGKKHTKTCTFTTFYNSICSIFRLGFAWRCSKFLSHTTKKFWVRYSSTPQLDSPHLPRSGRDWHLSAWQMPENLCVWDSPTSPPTYSSWGLAGNWLDSLAPAWKICAFEPLQPNLHHLFTITEMWLEADLTTQ